MGSGVYCIVYIRGLMILVVFWYMGRWGNGGCHRVVVKVIRILLDCREWWLSRGQWSPIERGPRVLSRSRVSWGPGSGGGEGWLVSLGLLGNKRCGCRGVVVVADWVYG